MQSARPATTSATVRPRTGGSRRPLSARDSSNTSSTTATTAAATTTAAASNSGSRVAPRFEVGQNGVCITVIPRGDGVPSILTGAAGGRNAQATLTLSWQFETPAPDGQDLRARLRAGAGVLGGGNAAGPQLAMAAASERAPAFAPDVPPRLLSDNVEYTAYAMRTTERWLMKQLATRLLVGMESAFRESGG